MMRSALGHPLPLPGGGGAGGEGHVRMSRRERPKRGHGASLRAGGGIAKGSKACILQKKENRRKEGYLDVPNDSHYCGRKRRSGAGGF